MVEARPRARLAILISGRGRNLRALDAAVSEGRIPAGIVTVVSNRRDAEGAAYARARGLPLTVLPHADFGDRAAFDVALTRHLDEQRVDIVALAGFMRVLGDAFVDHFAGRLLNIHPSLLPKYPGLDTHRRALAAGDARHGATVHFVTRALDGGPGIIQGEVRVSGEDDAARLAERVMEEVELKIYPQAVAWMARGDLRWSPEGPRFRDRPLTGMFGLKDLEEAFR